MIESTRRHERIANDSVRGIRFVVANVLAQPVQVFVPARAGAAATLLVHFHGTAYIPEQAVAAESRDYLLAVINLGAGSGVYERAFANAALLLALRDSVQRGVQLRLGRSVSLPRIVLSGFSAGSGAIRAILRTDSIASLVNGVLFLDGIHTSYVPEGRVQALGGTLDSTRLESIVRYARRAMRGETQMVVTHSEIFPGTFASTTETADYLLRELALARTPVLAWGPVGMQRLSEAVRGGFRLEGFAGNSAPDHIDHYHGFAQFLKSLN